MNSITKSHDYFDIQCQPFQKKKKINKKIQISQSQIERIYTFKITHLYIMASNIITAHDKILSTTK